jgi:hypothetical protein
MIAAHHVDQPKQRRIDLVLKQRGAGAGATAADHGHITDQILLHCGVAGDQAVLDRPERITRLQIHSVALLFTIEDQTYQLGGGNLL